MGNNQETQNAGGQPVDVFNPCLVYIELSVVVFLILLPVGRVIGSAAVKSLSSILQAIIIDNELTCFVLVISLKMHLVFLCWWYSIAKAGRPVGAAHTTLGSAHNASGKYYQKHK